VWLKKKKEARTIYLNEVYSLLSGPLRLDSSSPGVSTLESLYSLGAFFTAR
jgi:hypothetical protein